MYHEHGLARATLLAASALLEARGLPPDGIEEPARRLAAEALPSLQLRLQKQVLDDQESRLRLYGADHRVTLAELTGSVPCCNVLDS